MSAPTYDLGKLHGGLRLQAHKQMSTAEPIQQVPVPEQLILPLAQHAGDPAQPVVGIGEHVLKGQLIAECDGSLCAPVHASSSGKVVAIEPWPVSTRHGDSAPCIVIECDGEDTAFRVDENYAAYDKLAPEALLGQILLGGIAGLGGAVFPTAQKLMQATTCDVEYLILNGVECEPYISCDDALMREHGREVLGGAQILMHALGVDVCYIAVESDKPVAIQHLGEVLAEIDDERITIKHGADDLPVRRRRPARTTRHQPGSSQRGLAERRRLPGAERGYRCSYSQLDNRTPATDLKGDNN